MEMSLQQLRMLREVANRQTIAAAADSLGYTASAVSQQLSGLEKATGVAVLERVGRNVRLTDAGRELVRHADDLLAGMEAAQVAIERLSCEVRGTLAITVFESVAATMLVPLLDKLAVRHPDLHLRTRQMDPDLAMDALASGELDLAFTIDYPHAPAPLRDDVTRYSLLDDILYLVVREDDPLAAQGRVRLADLAPRPFIASPSGMSCGRCVGRRLPGRRVRARPGPRGGRLPDHAPPGRRRPGRLAGACPRPHRPRPPPPGHRGRPAGVPSGPAGLPHRQRRPTGHRRRAPGPGRDRRRARPRPATKAA